MWLGCVTHIEFSIILLDCRTRQLGEPKKATMRWSNHGKQTEENTSAKGSSAKAKQVSKGPFCIKAKKVSPRGLPDTEMVSAKMMFVAKTDAVKYITERCKKCHGKTVAQCLGMLYQGDDGKARKYGVSDLKYDIGAGRLNVVRV